MKVIDPILTFTFSLLVVMTTKKVFLDTVHLLLQASPPEAHVTEVFEFLVKNVNAVESCHAMHIWGLTNGKND